MLKNSKKILIIFSVVVILIITFYALPNHYYNEGKKRLIGTCSYEDNIPPSIRFFEGIKHLEFSSRFPGFKEDSEHEIFKAQYKAAVEFHDSQDIVYVSIYEDIKNHLIDSVKNHFEKIIYTSTDKETIIHAKKQLSNEKYNIGNEIDKKGFNRELTRFDLIKNYDEINKFCLFWKDYVLWMKERGELDAYNKYQKYKNLLKN